MTEYIENPLSGKLRGVTYEDGKIIDVHIRDTDDVVKVFVPMASEKEATGMAEYIEREAAMDVRGKLVELIGSTKYGNGSLVRNNFQKGFIEKIATHLVANGVTVQEWVSVDDRLPEEDDNYIVTACDEGCSAGEGIWYSTVVVVAEYYKGSWTWYEGGSEYSLEGIVTHWMPLPNPPKM